MRRGADSLAAKRRTECEINAGSFAMRRQVAGVNLPKNCRNNSSHEEFPGGTYCSSFPGCSKHFMIVLHVTTHS